ncbi:hypothetical protein [Propionivibrio sp.]|uniref:hypothetical protein n=1 Tax=Propionivibrio sp. TaxID=2212460 RepID=UPI003BF38F75
MAKKINPELLQKLDKRITNREFKLLLKPDGLDRHTRIGQLQKAIHDLCDESGIAFNSPETMVSGLRNIFFVDTSDAALHRNKLILRVRESRSNIWVDDWCEVTFKCRSENIDRAWAYNPIPLSEIAHRIRFKEEILKDGPVGSIRRIYSHNSVMDTVPMDLISSRKLSQLVSVFPGLSAVNLPMEKNTQMVGGRRNKILEACVTLGHIAFSETVLAHCEIGIWFHSIGKPMVGELAFAYRVHKANRKDIAAHQAAEAFFRKLQSFFADQLATGTTKTAMVYGSHE